MGRTEWIGLEELVRKQAEKIQWLFLGAVRSVLSVVRLYSCSSFLFWKPDAGSKLLRFLVSQTSSRVRKCYRDWPTWSNA